MTIQIETKDAHSQQKSIEPGWRAWSRNISLCGLLFLMTFAFGHWCLFRVDGNSMHPTLQNGAVVLVLPYLTEIHSIDRNKLLLLKYPASGVPFAFKRLVGIPDDCVTGKGEVVNAGHSDTCIIIMADRYFVIGDNRRFSTDSRDWGSIPNSAVAGRAIAVLWPLTQARIVH